MIIVGRSDILICSDEMHALTIQFDDDAPALVVREKDDYGLVFEAIDASVRYAALPQRWRLRRVGSALLSTYVARLKPFGDELPLQPSRLEARPASIVLGALHTYVHVDRGSRLGPGDECYLDFAQAVLSAAGDASAHLGEVEVCLLADKTVTVQPAGRADPRC